MSLLELGIGFWHWQHFHIGTFLCSGASAREAGKKMAEGVGFEPTVAVRPRLISSQVRSTRLRHPSEKREKYYISNPFFPQLFYFLC